jgi:hypothetical protein
MSVEGASKLLLDETGAEGEFVHFVRDPVTGETGLVIAVRGDAVGGVLEAVRSRRPSLGRRLARSFARD